MDYIWGASIAELCLRIMIDLWEMRNEDVYSKEEVTKQQKRKAKAAISVRALYKLEEIARPSDSFTILPGRRNRNRTRHSGDTKRIHCNENETNS